MFHLRTLMEMWVGTSIDYFTDYLIFFSVTPPCGPGPPHSQGLYITHNDAPHSIGLLWTSDQLVPETST